MVLILRDERLELRTRAAAGRRQAITGPPGRAGQYGGRGADEAPLPNGETSPPVVRLVDCKPPVPQAAPRRRD